MMDFQGINAALPGVAQRIEGIIGSAHTNVPGAEHIKRIIPLPSLMLTEATNDQEHTRLIVQWCRDQLAQELRGRVALVRRISIENLHDTINLPDQANIAPIIVRENVSYKVDVTYPALVYRLFVLPAEGALSYATATEEDAELREVIKDSAKNANPALWGCQCPMCEHHRTAAAIINGEGQGILLTVENAMRLRGQIQERQG